MAFPAILQHTGSVSGIPAPTSTSVPSLTELMNTAVQGTYGSSKSGRPGIVGATDLAPFVLAFETITKARFFCMRARGGSLKVLFTTAAGVDQAIRVSDLWMINTPAAGDEITSIKFVGTADVEYILAGDIS